MAKSDKKLSPKQALVKAQSLSKGIDNSVTIIDRERAKIAESATQLTSLVGGLANTVTSTPATKPEKTTAKKTTAKKTTAKKAATSKAKTEKKTADPNRPSLSDAIAEVLKDNGKMVAIEAKKVAVEKYGYWSNQAFYNMLKKDNGKTFKRDGNTLELVGSKASAKKTEDREVNEFVSKVASDETVSQTV